MINKQTAFSASCHNCGDVYCDEHREGFTLFSDEGDMIERMDSDGWFTGYGDAEHNGMVYCPACYKQDPEIDDKIIIDHKRKIPAPASVEKPPEQEAPRVKKDVHLELHYWGNLTEKQIVIEVMDKLKSSDDNCDILMSPCPDPAPASVEKPPEQGEANKKAWSDLWAKWCREKNFTYVGQLWEWLSENYHPPVPLAAHHSPAGAKSKEEILDRIERNNPDYGGEETVMRRSALKAMEEYAAAAPSRND